MRLPITRKLKSSGARTARKFFEWTFTRFIEIPYRDTPHVVPFDWYVVDISMGWGHERDWPEESS